MGLMTDSPTNPDPQTGTRRLSLWKQAMEGTGIGGDNARGDGYEALYLSDDEAGCAEVIVFPELIREAEDDPDIIHRYEVVEMTTIGRAVQEDGMWRPDDSASITYDYPFDFAFVTLEQAQRAADTYGQRDLSYALYLRRK